MILHEQAKDYWVICRRYNENRRRNPAITAVAVRDMIRLVPSCRSEAVKRRAHGFISQHREAQTSIPPNGDGPRFA